MATSKSVGGIPYSKSAAVRQTDLVDSKYTASLPELSNIFGCTEQQTRSYARQGMPQLAPGRYDLRRCVQWRIAELKNSVAKSSTVRDKLGMAQRERVLLEIEQARGHLIPREFAQTAISGLAAQFATAAESLAPRLAAELAELDDPALIQRRILEEARQVRAALADVIADMAKRERVEAQVVEMENDADTGD